MVSRVGEAESNPFASNDPGCAGENALETKRTKPRRVE